MFLIEPFLITKFDCITNWMILFWLSYTTFLIWPLFRGAEILTKTLLVFGSIWEHQKDISKITCLNKGQKRPCIDCWVQLQVINSYLSFSTQTNPLSVPLIVQRELKFPQLPGELFSPYLWYMKITFLPNFITLFIWNALLVPRKISSGSHIKGVYFL